ncbi:penicillin-binding protein 2, partial [Patescibacteria group bacterium]|nr:penicillin-binding protein 2 [Patescibacteria group bacterium]
IKGVNLYSQNWRYYPASNLASRVLGFAGFNENVIEGRYGLEKYYESILNKASGDFSLNNPFAEIIINFKKLISSIPEKGDVVTTIEPEVQILLEKSLKDLLEKYSSEMAGGLVMDPQTGRIIAMSVKPDFDPNRYNEEKISLFSNPIVQSVFEMGSIMKPLTLAAAMNEGAITPQTTYEDKGYVIFNNKRIENYDGKGRGVVNMQEVLNNSLNTGAVFAMEKLGKEKFKDYIINYGLGEKTGIDLPDEIQGLISNLDSNRDVEYATASFGQGIAVTPIEMISALASLANGGILVKPFIVEEIKNDQGFSRKIEPETRRQVLSQQTSKEMSRMLSNVVDNALLGGTVKLERYTIAAKTGTAQYKAEGEAGYREGEYIHTFFGYAPAFNARFITFLFLVRPQGARYASNSLTEPFMDITKFLLNYYEVPPDR